MNPEPLNLSAPFQFVAHGVAQPKGSTRVVPIVHKFPIVAQSVRDLSRVVRVTSDNVDVKRWQGVVSRSAWAALGDVPDAPAWRRLVTNRAVSFALVCDFFLPKPKRRRSAPIVKPDLDKLTRAVCDALTGVVWHDDAQIVSTLATKAYADNLAECRVECVIRATGVDVNMPELRARVAPPSQLPLLVESALVESAIASYFEPASPVSALDTVSWLVKAGAAITLADVKPWSARERTDARTWAFQQLDATMRAAPGTVVAVRMPAHVAAAHVQNRPLAYVDAPIDDGDDDTRRESGTP